MQQPRSSPRCHVSHAAVLIAIYLHVGSCTSNHIIESASRGVVVVASAIGTCVPTPLLSHQVRSFRRASEKF